MNFAGLRMAMDGLKLRILCIRTAPLYDQFRPELYAVWSVYVKFYDLTATEIGRGIGYHSFIRFVE
jgi:hypothetical protein